MTESAVVERLWDEIRRQHETELHRLRSAVEALPRPKPTPVKDAIRYRPEILRPAQRRVAGLIADELLDIEIADTLGIRPHTVQQHISAACARLGLPTTNRVKLANMVRAYREGTR